MTIIDRLSKLEGPNRRLDHEMHILFFVPDDKKSTVEWNHQGSYVWRPADGFINFDTVPAYTASVDAAIALAERVLPGWKRQLLEDFNGKWIARVCSQRRELFSTDYLRETELGGSPNAAIALCIALLSAKEDSHDQ